MTMHSLTAPGRRRTACGLVVPDIMPLPSNATTWDDGDDPGLCVDGCHKLSHHDSPANLASPFQRFRAMASKPGVSGRHQIGTAVVNRDKSITVSLDSIPANGKVFLVPEVP